MSKGYWLATYKKIGDLEKLKKYAETVTPIIKSFGGQALVRGGKSQILEGENAIELYRKIMGATNPAEADNTTIRKKFATSIQETAVHGSDSEDNALKELNFFFKDI